MIPKCINSKVLKTVPYVFLPYPGFFGGAEGETEGLQGPKEQLQVTITVCLQPQPTTGESREKRRKVKRSWVHAG